MENVVWLQPDKPITINEIKSILWQGANVKYTSKELNLTTDFPSPEKYTTISFAEIKDYALGFGTEVPAEITQVMLLLGADFIANHPVSNGPAIITRIIEFLQFEVYPQVFTQGLMPSFTAHALLPVFSTGKVYYQGYLLNATDVHDIFSWEPLSWPENFPDSLLSYPILDLAVLVYSFIQFTQIQQYAQVLFSDSNSFQSSINFFQTQTDSLNRQLQAALIDTDEQSRHLSDLGNQFNKLTTTFGEYINQYIASQKTEFKEHLSVSENFTINLNLLHQLLEQLTQKNSSMLTACSPAESSNDPNAGKLPVMQPYQALLNLEHIMALATLIQLNIVHNKPDFISSQLANTYLNQVIAVLKEVNFAELIQKTVTFMYATCKANNPVA